MHRTEVVRNYTDLYRRASTFTDKIFKGANPIDLPVELPFKFELVVDCKAARALGSRQTPSPDSKLGSDDLLEDR